MRLVGESQLKFGIAQRLTWEKSATQEIFIMDPAENIWTPLVTGQVKLPLLFTGASGVVGRG